MDGVADGRDESEATPGDDRPGRRRVLRAVGVAGVTAVGGAALGACGGATSTDGARAGGAVSTGSAADGIPLGDVPVGGGRVLSADRVVVTQPAAGTYKAFDSTCPHQGCAVSMVTEQGIICACHGSVFDATTGERRSGPAERGLTPRSVTVDGDELTVS